MNDDLENALSAIDGVERSEVDLSEHGPLAIRVGLARGADRLVVAEAVQRLLEARGLRSRVAPDRREPAPVEPPAPPAGPQGPGPPPRRTPPPPQVTLEESEPSSPAEHPAGLESVTVSEALDGLAVTVIGDGGRSAVRSARRTETAMREAIVSAVAELIYPDGPPPGLRGVELSEKYPAVTVYLEDQAGNLRVGSSLVAAGGPFAFAQAVWSALRP